MKRLLMLTIAMTSLNVMAEIPADTHLGCQLYTGEPLVFKDLTKFSISKKHEDGTRTLEAYSAETEDGSSLFGECSDDIETGGLTCSYTSSRGKELTVTLDDLRTNEIEGVVIYDRLIFDPEHEVSCDLLTY